MYIHRKEQNRGKQSQGRYREDPEMSFEEQRRKIAQVEEWQQDREERTYYKFTGPKPIPKITDSEEQNSSAEIVATESSLIEGKEENPSTEQGKIEQAKLDLESDLGTYYQSIEWESLDLMYNIVPKTINGARNLLLGILNFDSRTRGTLLDFVAKKNGTDLGGFYDAKLDPSQYLKVKSVNGELKIVERGSIKEQLLDILGDVLLITSVVTRDKVTGFLVKNSPILAGQLKKVLKKAIVKEGNGLSVNNIGEFQTRIPFGKSIKLISQKLKLKYQGQSIYKILDKDKGYLKKGDHYYLDGLHKNHIEVFDKNGNFKIVLNLDGTKNIKKSKLAEGRTINLK